MTVIVLEFRRKTFGIIASFLLPFEPVAHLFLNSQDQSIVGTK